MVAFSATHSLSDEIIQNELAATVIFTSRGKISKDKKSTKPKDIGATSLRTLWGRTIGADGILDHVTVVMPSTEDGPILSSSGGHMVEKVNESGNNEGTQDENMDQTPISSSINPNIGTSYAKLFTRESSRKSVNFRTLITPVRNGADVVVQLESILAISERFINMAYGFFLGKRVAYPVVANYVRKTCGKYGLVKLMLNSSTSLFFFQFSYMNGLDLMLENGLWSSYARAMIELRADVELKDTIVMAMPKFVEEGFHTYTIHVEYEWKPPKSVYCKVFGHVQDECPKNIGSGVAKNLKNPNQAPLGVPVGPKTNIDGKLTLVDDEGKPLEKVEYSGDHDSEDKVELVDNEMASFMASRRVDYGQEIPDNIQSICDNLDIKVRGRKKK
ncbi:hypothetical protein Tco_0595143 [Tanacetum coccineum]